MQNLNLLIFASSIIVAVIYASFWLNQPASLARSLFKTLPIAILTLFAFIANAPVLLILALLLSAAGDAFLSGNDKRNFILGLASFLLAHLVFIALFVSHPSINSHEQITLALIIGASALLIYLVLANLWPLLGDMKIPVTCYAIVIASMNIAAWASAQSSILLLGVASFITSDTILAHTLFFWQNKSTKLIASHLLWITYIAAQIIITSEFVA